MAEALEGKEVDGVLMDLGVSNNQVASGVGVVEAMGFIWVLWCFSGFLYGFMVFFSGFYMVLW